MHTLAGLSAASPPLLPSAFFALVREFCSCKHWAQQAFGMQTGLKRAQGSACARAAPEGRSTGQTVGGIHSGAWSIRTSVAFFLCLFLGGILFGFCCASTGQTSAQHASGATGGDGLKAAWLVGLWPHDQFGEQGRRAQWREAAHWAAVRTSCSLARFSMRNAGFHRSKLGVARDRSHVSAPSPGPSECLSVRCSVFECKFTLKLPMPTRSKVAPRPP